MEKVKPEKITKINAAERQIKEAIRLFFERRDSVSIHTLAGAAHQIFYDLGKKRGLLGFLKDDTYIQTDRLKGRKWEHIVNDPKSFFKHADRNPDKILNFYPEFNELLLFDLCHLCQKIKGKSFREIDVFQAWFLGKYPNFFAEKLKKEIEKVSDKQLIEDYEHFLNLLNEPTMDEHGGK